MACRENVYEDDTDNIGWTIPAPKSRKRWRYKKISPLHALWVWLLLRPRLVEYYYLPQEPTQ